MADPHIQEEYWIQWLNEGVWEDTRMNHPDYTLILDWLSVGERNYPEIKYQLVKRTTAITDEVIPIKDKLESEY